MTGLLKHDRTSSHLLSGHSEERTAYHTTTSAWKMPLSWHWTGHSEGYWQQAQLRREMMQAEQYWTYGLYRTPNPNPSPLVH